MSLFFKLRIETLKFKKELSKIYLAELEPKRIYFTIIHK
ncbi:hypothetical protein LEP1GSC124_2607 [Leptospira interrogans serovar Pyrogenes str. 200701872]|uniref:Uncharacterized protein n=1 Tax=Leptospira interrogans serovar Pyrogenes str. 200701872 TaxID=1193029 RepID=M6ZHP8_LEPIR|nr:hypothetical protein LEP1GSC124_2607 [Leptospira interrogans serovar Pyrogenes str. 200701872]